MSTPRRKSDKLTELPQPRWYTPPEEPLNPRIELPGGIGGLMTRKFGSDGDFTDDEQAPFDSVEARYVQ
jgi:hypothetical protein